MPVTSYRIWWGGPVNPNALDLSDCPLIVSVTGIAKPPKAAHPLEVVNEIVCADLGRGISLPIPVGIVATKEAGNVPHYVSFSVSLAGEQLPPANAEAIAIDLPDLACGVILFDLWIANADRSQTNLAYDEDSKTLHLIDHGRALFCGANWRGRLGSLDDAEIIKGNCLTPHLRSLDGFAAWGKRIKALPEEYIADIVGEAKKLNVPESDINFCTSFLLKRRTQLLKIIKKHKREFHAVGRGNSGQKHLFSGSPKRASL